MTNTKTNKTSRSKETRENTVRKRGWVPPSSLQAPEPPEGFHHRWVRAEIRGVADDKNIMGRLRSGYEFVRADQYPDRMDLPLRWFSQSIVVRNSRTTPALPCALPFWAVFSILNVPQASCRPSKISLNFWTDIGRLQTKEAAFAAPQQHELKYFFGCCCLFLLVLHENVTRRDRVMKLFSSLINTNVLDWTYS